MQDQPADRQGAHGSASQMGGPAPQPTGFASKATGPAAHQPVAAAPGSHAGVVIRRSPPSPGQGQATWPVSRPLPSNVDILDKSTMPGSGQSSAGTAPSSNVDITDNARSRATRPPPSPPKRPVPKPPSSYNVDIVDNRPQPARIGAGAATRSVSIPPIPVPPRPDRPAERTGPDEARFLAVVESRKQMLVDRAAARGRDPNAGALMSPVAQGKTRSRKTHEDYLRRGESLMERYKRFASLTHLPAEAIDPVDFVNYCFSIKPTIKASAWRPYKQGIRTVLDTLPHERTSEAINLLDADINEDTGEKKKKPINPDADPRQAIRKTSADKEKRFPKKHFDQVLSYLKMFARSKHSAAMVDWMVATLATGLRPIEWASTDFEVRDDPTMPNGKAVWLYVLNAKATNGRALGLVRTLDLSYCSEETISAVRRMSERGFEWLRDGEFDAMQRQCSQVLYKACDAIYSLKGKTYSLYSLRHQFVANSKSLYKNEEVSAMCGHLVVDTAVANYGKKTSAWAPEEIRDRARPVENEVAMVQPRITYFKQKIAHQIEAGLIKGSPGFDAET